MMEEEQYIFVPNKRPKLTRLLIDEYEQKYKECMESNAKLLKYEQIALEYAKNLKLSQQKINELQETIKQQSFIIKKQSILIEEQNADPRSRRAAKIPSSTKKNIKYLQPIKSIFTKK